jgi:hypothetical protein
MNLSNPDGKRYGELILELEQKMLQLMVVVRRDCQYLHRVNQALLRESSVPYLRQKIKAVICGEHDMMLFTLVSIKQES